MHLKCEKFILYKFHANVKNFILTVITGFLKNFITNNYYIQLAVEITVKFINILSRR